MEPPIGGNGNGGKFGEPLEPLLPTLPPPPKPFMGPPRINRGWNILMTTKGLPWEPGRIMPPIASAPDVLPEPGHIGALLKDVMLPELGQNCELLSCDPMFGHIARVDPDWEPNILLEAGIDCIPPIIPNCACGPNDVCGLALNILPLFGNIIDDPPEKAGLAIPLAFTAVPKLD